MTYPKQARTLLAGAVVLLALVTLVGWWASSPDTLSKTGLATSMLMLSLGSIHRIRRMPKASPVVLCASIAGLGFPYMAAKPVRCSPSSSPSWS